MNWLKDNWQLKLVAFLLALFLWTVLYLNPPAAVAPVENWPPPVRPLFHAITR